jgi:hypothetical protein
MALSSRDVDGEARRLRTEGEREDSLKLKFVI